MTDWTRWSHLHEVSRSFANDIICVGNPSNLLLGSRGGRRVALAKLGRDGAFWTAFGAAPSFWAPKPIQLPTGADRAPLPGQSLAARPANQAETALISSSSSPDAAWVINPE